MCNGWLRKYQRHHVWGKSNKQHYNMYRLIIYLQNHTLDDGALQVAPGTHLMPGNFIPRKKITLHPDLGDAVLFDMRLLHKGTHIEAEWGSRVAIQVSFGAPNIFTNEWKRCDTTRRNYQMSRIAYSRPLRESKV